MEREDPAGANALGDVPQGRSWVAYEHEHAPSHSGVKESPGFDRPSIGSMEPDVGDSFRCTPLLRDLDDLAVEIDADDGAFGAD